MQTRCKNAKNKLSLSSDNSRNGSFVSIYLVSANIRPSGFRKIAWLASLHANCITLLIGPLTILDSKYASLIEPRRAIGLAAFVLIIAHLLSAIYLLYGGFLEPLLSQFSVQLGAVAASLAAILALTSSDYAVKSLGSKTWKTVQRANYLVFIFAFAHFLLQFERKEALLLSNLAEFSMVLLGITTIAMQIIGFIKVKQRKEGVNSGKE